MTQRQFGNQDADENPLRQQERGCTCHGDDEPPRPCPQKFAYTECLKAALSSAERQRDEAVAALRPFAEVTAKHAERYERLGSDQFETMPGHWPIKLKVTMDDARAARRLLKPVAGEPQCATGISSR